MSNSLLIKKKLGSFNKKIRVSGDKALVLDGFCFPQ
jgi:hypothetical protein